MFLSLVEYMIPKPVPFLRIGLANLPVLLSLSLLSGPQVLLLVAVKVIGQGLVSGTLFSYIFLLSASGSFASALTMMAIRKIGGNRISLIGISVSGALLSTAVQLLFAYLLIFGSAVKYIAPPFLLAGLVSAVILGYLSLVFQSKSAWYRRVSGL